MNFKLRKWELSYINNLVEHANNYNIAKFLTDGFPYPYTPEDGIKFIQHVSEEEPLKVFAIEIEGKAVGSIGIFPQSDIHKKNAEIGYWLSEKYWGQGIMVEVIKQIVEYGFKTFDIYRIFARPFSTNQQSQAVLTKAGFKYEATFKKALYKNGVFIDEIYFSIYK
ncbi:GNAT family N-acetyltransferase [Dysgonomonas sp. Marseille-P4677]|uniref:GNAT family N-acetyltransferase n=1 Tax=Dysgonomonas sp. Marseille-P4677 TaxID=2364790 RepID=UPI001912FDCF|nr:GNAT family protein [Dysgonomonas sp. Marseille-P4677]MBK5723028.1 GNAT family N-acetyltransferase [Dysgonomonas sp. Marseille-P4677]